MCVVFYVKCGVDELCLIQLKLLGIPCCDEHSRLCTEYVRYLKKFD